MNLDDINKIKQLDKSNMAGSVEELYLQLEQTWEDIQTIKVPPQYKTAKNVVVAGMGGSALGPHVIKSLYFDRLSIPLEIVNDYHLPEYVNKDALVLLSSNSGTTEEVLSAAEDADKRGAMIMGMTTGGKLKKFLEIKKVPAYIFQQRHNPSGQPRMGTGYMILGMLGLFHQAGLIKIGESEVKTSIGLLKKLNKEWGLDTESNKNKAKQFAKQCHGKAVFTVSSSFLLGNAHTFNNQLNENAKNFSSFFALPEINHHLMEGLRYPESNSNSLVFVFLNSNKFSERIRKRFKLTMDVVEKNNVAVLEYNPTSETRLTQVFETLLFGSYVGFYIAMLNNLNPSPIPWVDYFKKKLA